MALLENHLLLNLSCEQPTLPVNEASVNGVKKLEQPGSGEADRISILRFRRLLQHLTDLANLRQTERASGSLHIVTKCAYGGKVSTSQSRRDN